MAALRHGCKWTKKEDNILKDMFNRHAKYGDMAIRLGRTWYACKCRCIRLGLLDDSFAIYTDGKDTVPKPYTLSEVEEIKVQVSGQKLENIPSTFTISPIKLKHTFSNEELDIVLDYLKARIAKNSVRLLDKKDTYSIALVEKYLDFLKDEVSKVNNLKLMSEDEKEKILTKVIVA